MKVFDDRKLVTISIETNEVNLSDAPDHGYTSAIGDFLRTKIMASEFQAYVHA